MDVLRLTEGRSMNGHDSRDPNFQWEIDVNNDEAGNVCGIYCPFIRRHFPD